MLLQTALFNSFLWLSNAPLYLAPHLLDPVVCHWARGSLPHLGCRNQRCCEHRGVRIFPNQSSPLFWIHAQERVQLFQASRFKVFCYSSLRKLTLGAQRGGRASQS